MTPLPETLDRLAELAAKAQTATDPLDIEDTADDLRYALPPATVLRLVAIAKAAVEAERLLEGMIDHDADDRCTCATDEDGGYGCPVRLALSAIDNLRRAARGTP